MTVSSPLRFDVFTSAAQLAEEIPGWDRLSTWLDAPFARRAWTLSCAEALADTVEPFVAVLREADGRAAAVASLARPRKASARLYQLGVEDHGETTDFSYRDEEALDQLSRELAARRLPLLLGRLPADSPVTASLRRAYASHGHIVTAPRPACPFIEIAGSEDDVSSRLSSRLRSDLRRGRRKAERVGAVRLTVATPATRAELEPLWSEALRIEAAGWKGERGSALARDLRVGTFYRSFALRACEQGTLRILFLELGTQGAASMIALVDEGRMWILKIGYDERFAACSPGMLLLYEGLRYAAREGLRSYEFMGADSAWTHRWTDEGHATQAVGVYPYSLRGLPLAVRDAGHRVWSKLRRHNECQQCHDS